MGLWNFENDPWDEPDNEDYYAVDEELLTTLLMGQIDGLRPVKASVEFTDIRQTAQWYLAFDIEGWESRRREFAQKKVAERTDKELSAVQGKVRDVYDAKAGRKTAQELFEDDLEAVEQHTRVILKPDNTTMSVNTSRGAKERAHRQAQERDLREYFRRGEMIEAYVQTPTSENGGEEAVAVYSRDPVQDARVFIDQGSHNLYRGCRVRCRVRYCNDNFLKALAVYRID